MKVADVWEAALLRIGADRTGARQMIAFISSCASSQAAFDARNTRLPDPAGRALMKGIESPDGVNFSRELVDSFRKQVMERFDISEEEIQQILSGIGSN